MAKITTPVEGYTGEVVGVQFIDGVGETDDEGALAYFRRQGYAIDGEPSPEEAPVEEAPVEEAPAHKRASGS